MSFTVSAEQLVYGPVPSRRLGRSLGVDLVPLKTCASDCVYCQLGRTTRRTVRRQSRVDPSDVAAQVRAKLDSDPDVIALAGSGEPTLYAGIGEVIAGIKRLTDVPVAVVTNGSLLSHPTVRRGLVAADIVLPSLDAPDGGLFQLISRPHTALRFDEVLGGMIAFRRDYSWQLWLEVMLPADGSRAAPSADILALLSRRPCTTADIAAGLGLHHSEALKAATALVDQSVVELHTHEGESFYLAAPAATEHPKEEQS